MWLKLSLKLARPTIIGCIYRPQDASHKDSIFEIENMLDECGSSINDDLVILGDVNIDLNKTPPSSTALKSFLHRHNLSQLIDRPTRVTAESSTLIDHIYINNSNLYWHAGTLDPSLSDHNLIYTCRKHHEPSKEKVTRFIRNYRNFNAEDFARDIDKIDWSEVQRATDLDEAVALFNFELLCVINKHLPWKTIRARKVSAPWITSEFLSLIDRRE